jgi:chromosome segregation ATPase
VIRRLMHACGLVSRGEFLTVEEKLRAARQRLDLASERLLSATAASDERQASHRDELRKHKERVAALEMEQVRRAERAGEAAEQASRRIAALEEELRSRDAALEAVLRDETVLEQRVAAALQELQLARESLAAVEVKLDILEGAANVLDGRTRAGSRTP